MLEVIGAGLPRTGTSSSKVALERLGFGPCYHMFELQAHPEHAERWLPLAGGATVDWHRVLAGYVSTQDWPASHYWRELADAYPRAKVVLTVRDPHEWYVSFRALMARGAPPGSRSSTVDEPVAVARMRPVLNLVGRAYFGPGWCIGDDLPDEAVAVAAARRHEERVRAALSPERLLVFDVRQGWAPLCAFLDVQVPPGEPFPRVNDARWLSHAFERLRREGRMPSPFR